ncbi:hypothetical protein TrLO_g3841 [Triparma laevis f. longispina]|uniref:Uncharacterized protein n=1 Tax=Triparma laevis f. longispina TaxID=1714387 RepID=A0A9W7C8I1_9STRA|nr:hypothetical protein TrLO_g3841 [Triparma laevis f. longispina]
MNCLATLLIWYCLLAPQSWALKTGPSSSFFTGGYRANANEITKQASSMKIAPTTFGFPAKSGITIGSKPKHRAWGGETEPPVQSKALPNIDMSSVDPWITFEEMAECSALKNADDDVKQAIFVSLAGGQRYLNRERCEHSLSKWTDGSSNKFSAAGFERALRDGRVDLAQGWAVFLLLTVGFASCIVAPTSPAPRAIEAFIDSLTQKI